jgi:tellurite resistance protein
VWPANSLFVVSAVVWLTVLVTFIANRGRLLLADAEDPVFAPFVSLAFITPVLLGGALTPYWSLGGKVVAFTAIALTVLFGVWLIGTWILTEMTLAQWHPGYFLPTVAGGLVSSAVSADLGAHQLAIALFGFGTISWLVLGSILLVRLFTEPMVPPPLIPTLAIEVAPPIVASNAWFAINGGHIDAVALLLVGYAILMTLLQVRLIALFRSAPFGPGFWAFSFSYAAVFADAIQWLTLEHAHGAKPWTYVLLAVVTTAFAALITRTGKGLAQKTFLPRPPAAAPSPTKPRRQAAGTGA